MRRAFDRPPMAYAGTFRSPLRDVLPTQVDLPPGNDRGIRDTLLLVEQIGPPSKELVPPLQRLLAHDEPIIRGRLGRDRSRRQTRDPGHREAAE